VRIPTITLIALTLAFTGADAFAKKPKKKKEAAAATKEEAGKDGDKDEKGGKAKVQKLTAGGPTLQYERFRRNIEFKVAEKREEQISGIKRLLDLGPKQEEVPDLKFRLAELYFDKARFYFFRAQEADDKSLQSKSPGEKEALLDEKKANTKESKEWAARAVELYKEIRDRFPKYKRMPEVLFALGQSYWSNNQYQAAIEVYAELIRNFKDSPLVPEAWVAFGEFYFNEGDVNKALKSYEKASYDKRSRVYGFALYKMGWCYYNLSKWDEALKKFKATIIYSQLAEELSGENKIALGKEAQKDYVKAYRHVGDPKRARFLFGDLTDDANCTKRDCQVMLELLADMWTEDGYFDESSMLYKQLISLDAKSSRNPLFQGKVVDLLSRAQDKKRTIRECRALVDLYQKGKEQVSQLIGKSEQEEKARENIAEAETMAETTIRKLSQVWNKEAIKLRQKDTYEDARTMYEMYLQLFPQSKYGYEMRFQLADLYYKLEKFDDAARSYEATVLAAKATPPLTQYLVEAANDNILSLEEFIKDLKIKNPKPSEQPQPIHKEKQRLIDACDRYVQLVPADKADKLVEVKANSAKILYDFSHYEEAIKRFDEIVRNHPSAPQAEVGANLIIDIYNIRKDWEKLYQTVVEYSKIDELMKDREQLQKDFAKFAEHAKFSLVQILEERVNKERGDIKKVAQAYEDFYSEFPKSENADKALYNSSVAWDKAGMKEKGEELRKKLLEEYPKSPLCVDVAYHIGKHYEERTEYGKAAEELYSFAKKYPADERSRDAMYNAAVFYAGTGSVKKGNEIRLEYLKTYGKAKGGEKESADIYWTIAQDLDRAGRWGDAANRYAEFAKQFSKDERFFDAKWNEAKIRREKLRHFGAADKLEDEILGTYQYRAKRGQPTGPNAARYAGLIAFRKIDENWKDYAKIRIPTPNLKNPTAFKRALQDKAQARDKMIKSYTKIVTDYQQAESTISALYKIALAWDEFVDKLGAVGCPRGIPDEACQIIKQEMDTMMGPPREASYQAYRTCVAKSNELNTFTEFSTKCVHSLEKLAPNEFPPMAEKQVELTAIQAEFDTIESNGLILEVTGMSSMKQEHDEVPPPPATEKPTKKEKAPEPRATRETKKAPDEDEPEGPQ
jgi:cellulose synthase operon protein C